MVQPQQPQWQPPSYQSPQYQPPGPPQQPPRPVRKVGAGGCITSIALFLLSIVAVVGIIAWAVLGIVNSLRDAPAVPVGTIGEVTITETGQQFVFIGNLDGRGTLPALDPEVVITGPDGVQRFISPYVSSSGSSPGTEVRTVGQFDANLAGAYTIDSTSAEPRPGLNLFVTNFNVTQIGLKFGLAFLIGGLLFLLSVIFAIVWLVRRSRAKRGPVYG